MLWPNYAQNEFCGQAFSHALPLWFTKKFVAENFHGLAIAHESFTLENFRVHTVAFEADN